VEERTVLFLTSSIRKKSPIIEREEERKKGGEPFLTVEQKRTAIGKRDPEGVEKKRGERTSKGKLICVSTCEKRTCSASRYRRGGRGKANVGLVGGRKRGNGKRRFYICGRRWKSDPHPKEKGTITVFIIPGEKKGEKIGGCNRPSHPPPKKKKKKTARGERRRRR